jgi:HK97 family phage prohead protease
MHGEACLIWPGAFSKSLSDGTIKNLCVDHNRDVVYADTRSGLHISDADDGLLFRVILARTKNPCALMGMVESENRRCMSIGYEPVATEIRQFGNHPARVITEARLVELSLVADGKSKPAFVYITDASPFLAPTADARSLDFSLADACYRVGKASKAILRALDENNRSLTERLNRLCVQAGIDTGATGVTDNGMSDAGADIYMTLDRILAGLAKLKVD